MEENNLSKVEIKVVHHSYGQKSEKPNKDLY